jgi:hypothetical protein
VILEKIAQAGSNSLNLLSLNWFLAMSVHAFVSALQAVLKWLVSKVTGGHRITARI